MALRGDHVALRGTQVAQRTEFIHQSAVPSRDLDDGRRTVNYTMGGRL